MALTESQLAALTSAVAARITGTVLGREASSASATEIEVAGSAVIFCYQVAPDAPEAILREASIRLAGWIYGNRPHVSEHEITDPSGTTTKLRFNNSAATANGWRASGASALLARYIKRRGGLIDATSERVTGTVAAPDPDIGTTVMRCGFSDSIPHGQSTWRWVGTVNSVELDTSWNQPASFAFWIPGDLMLRVVAIALLRSVSPGTPGDPVTLDAFSAPEPYMFGNTVGLARSTPVTFEGQFAWPNDFRAVLGELR